MNSPNQDKNLETTSTHEHARDAGFEMAEDDPRRTDNRGGLEAIVDAGETASEELAVEQGRDVVHGGDIGEVQGSQSGAGEPQLEVTDVGLIDVNASGTSAADEDEQQSDGAARVLGSDGQPL